jgi:CRP/FNR family transcriptional regulator, anaerobic regulatory protein
MEAREAGASDGSSAGPADRNEGSAAPFHGCEKCGLKSGCLPRALAANDLKTFSTLARLKRQIRPGALLFSAGNPLTGLYVVRTGTFKTVAISREGDPKITGFYLPGDVLGLHALSARTYLFDAIALEHSEVCVLPIRQLEGMLESIPQLQREFIRALSDTISRDRRLLLMGCMDAEQRVSRLLLSLADRYQRLGYAREELLLHMTRDDIASYLCLSSETVSRVISRLRRKGVLTVNQRHIGFTDCVRLAKTSAW